MRIINSLIGAARDAVDHAADRVDEWAEDLRGQAPGAVDWRARAVEAEAMVLDLRGHAEVMQVQVDLIAIALNAIGKKLPDDRGDDRVGEYTADVIKALAAERDNGATAHTALLKRLARMTEDVEQGNPLDEGPKYGPDTLPGRLQTAIRRKHERAMNAITEANDRTRQFEDRLKEANTEAGTALAELNGMHERERWVERVLDAFADDKNPGAMGVPAETPAERVLDAMRALQQRTIHAERVLADNGGGARRQTVLIEALVDAYDRGEDVRDRPLDVPAGLAGRVRDALAGTAADGSMFMPAGQARQAAHTITVALNMYDKGQDPLASLTLAHPLDLSGRVVAALSGALAARKAIAEAQADSGAAAAARIRQTITDVQAHLAPDRLDDEAAFANYIDGMERAAQIAGNEPDPGPDEDVAHIDTVNGRAAAREAAESNRTE